MTFHVPNQYRIRTGRLGSDDSYGNNGAFRIVRRMQPFMVIASDGADWDATGMAGQPWEHVSVSAPGRCPTWEEMCHIKAMFWDDEDTVVQFHPPRSEYINNHPYCLHLWRPVVTEIPLPPRETVGIK